MGERPGDPEAVPLGALPPRRTVEIACDESGFVGGSLFGQVRVFAHASVHLALPEAEDLVEEVRRRTGAGAGELKASRLNRPWGRPVAAWLCGAAGPLQGRAVVHVTDTHVFGLARLAQVLTGDSCPEGWWSADEDPAAWALALRLHELVTRLPEPARHLLLEAARDLLWLTRSTRPQEPVEAWLDAVGRVSARLSDAEGRHLLAGLASERAVQRARCYLLAPPACPLTEPLLPALRRTLRHWSALGDPDVVHDEQSALTPARVAAIGAELATSCPGRRVAGFRRVDSRADARVQLADLVAGVVRRALEDGLAAPPRGGTPEVAHLVAHESFPAVASWVEPGYRRRATR
jgi:hypothetical protein